MLVTLWVIFVLVIWCSIAAWGVREDDKRRWRKQTLIQYKLLQEQIEMFKLFIIRIPVSFEQAAKAFTDFGKVLAKAGNQLMVLGPGVDIKPIKKETE